MMPNLSFVTIAIILNILTSLSYIPADDERILTKEELEEIYHSLDTYDDSPPTVLYFFKKTPAIYHQVINKIPFPNYTCYDHEYATVNELDLNVKISKINDQPDINIIHNEALVDISDKKDSIELLILDSTIESLGITFYCSKRQYTNQTTFLVGVKAKDKLKTEYPIQIIYYDEMNEDEGTLNKLKNISYQIWAELTPELNYTFDKIIHERMSWNTSNILNYTPFYYSMMIDLNLILCLESKTIENISNNIRQHLKQLNFTFTELKIKSNLYCNHVRGEVSFSKYVAPIIIVLIVIIMGSICCTGILFHRRRRFNNNANIKLIFKPKKPAILIEEIDYNNDKKNAESLPLRYDTMDKDKQNDIVRLNNYKSTRDPPPYEN